MSQHPIDTSNPQFQQTLQLMQFTTKSVFLTGKAGTGKSTFLKYLCSVTKKKYVVLAPTGIAAIQAGGVTLHSFFKLPFHPLLPDDSRFTVRKLRDYLKYNTAQVKLLKNLELIIIDEISMVRADIIDFIDKVLRVYSGRMREPFGGKQLLLVGDLFQLEPVLKSDEREILDRFYPNPFFFSAKVFQKFGLVSIELDKIYRQKDDTFISILNRIRNNSVISQDIQAINTRVGASIPSTDQTALSITLATRRDTADTINEHELAAITHPEVTLRGEIKGDFPENNLPTLLELTIKEEAQIIFIKNDYEKRWVNGTLGKILSIHDEELQVMLEDGRVVNVSPVQWANIRYTYNEKERKIEEEVLGTFSQYPIRLAWAITVHKSQGLTFKHVTIDFSGGVFAAGQAYVALSRCTSLEGMQLKRPLNRSDIFVRPEILNFARQFNNQSQIQKAMQQAQADILYTSALTAFDKGDFASCLDELFKAMHTRYDLEKPLVRRFLQRKLQIINQLKQENKHLRQEQHETRERLKKYADEYYQMGNECITRFEDKRAALANYDKALTLYPNHADARIMKAQLLFKSEQTENALSELSHVIKSQPGNFKAFYNRGKIFLKLKRIEEAFRDLDKATSLKPENPTAHKYFGEVLLQMGRKEDAERQFYLAEMLRLRRKNKSND